MPIVTGDFVELKPNPDLLNPKFGSYKISFDKYLQRRQRLRCNALYRQAGSSQFGFEHLKLFSDINYLYSDLFSLNGIYNRFYVFLDDDCLHSFTFDGNNFHTVIIEADIKCNCNENFERYPPTLSFVNEEYVVISNGCGVLSLFFTGQRDRSINWKKVMSCEIHFSENKIGPFVILESRQFNQNRYEVLLRSIVSHEKSPGENPSHMFWNRLHWISIRNGDGQWYIENVREILCKGHLEFATIDFGGENIILAGNEDYCFSKFDKHKTSDEEKNLGYLANEVGVKESGDGHCEGNDATYIWTQNNEFVTVYFKLPGKINKNDVNLVISTSNIHFSYLENDLLRGIVGGLVDPVSSTYTISGNKLELTLFKAKPCCWTSVVVGDIRGVQEFDRDALDAAYLHLEGIESSESGQFFNTDLLEECDVSDDELSKVLWISGSSFGVEHTADISGNVVLFTYQLPNKPRMFCIRMDVDGILWSFNSDESQPVVHTTTFDAFGYVEASKNEKKFVTCSSDFKYVAIVETTRRAYIYWQLPKNGDQKSIGSSSETSKQCLITLRHQGANCEGDNEFDTNNIIGVYAGKCAFYLLTSKDLFAFVFDYNENQ